MKKTILTLGILVAAQSCFAYIEEGSTANVQRLQNSGYSQAALRIIDKSVEQSQGAEMQYVRYYQDYKPKNKLSGAYTRAKNYLDPAQEDYFFGKHENDFSNAWFYDLHDSSRSLKAEPTVTEDL